MLKPGKVYTYFVEDCLEIFFLVFTFLKMHGNSKNDQYLVEQVKHLHKHCPALIGAPSSTKFRLTLKCEIVISEVYKFMSILQLSCCKYEF